MKKIAINVFLALVVLSSQKVIAQNKLSNREVARFYFEEVVNKQKLDMLNKVYADSFLVHVLTDNTDNPSTIATQHGFLKYLLKAFPDIHYTISEMYEEGDKIAVRLIAKGTHKGEFWGHPASGNSIKNVSDIFFFRFKDGKVVESWVQLDLHQLFKQIKGE